MNSPENYMNFLKESAKNSFLPILGRDFGYEALEQLGYLTDNISSIYRNIRIRDFESIIIYTPLDESVELSTIAPHCRTVSSAEAFVSVNCNSLVIEVSRSTVTYCTDWECDIDYIRKLALVYKYERSNEMEVFFGKTDISVLPHVPDSESYFQFKSYKDLEEALEEYEEKRARYSSCPFLKDIWHTSNRILFIPGPEETMQNSLYDFLSIRLRDNPEVMPEQNVNRSNPVDIKISWKYSSHVAFIEIKWLGKSFDPATGNMSVKTDTHIRGGADQLAGYLDSNHEFARTKIVTGYLVVFDGRRRHTNKDTTSISQENGFYYRNRPVNFITKYEDSRIDFEQPRRFFMEPKTQ